MAYKSDKTGVIDYEQLRANAKLFRPDVIIAGSKQIFQGEARGLQN